MTAAVSDETDDEGRGVSGMKQSHEFLTREASNPNDWLRTRLPNFIAVRLDETEDRAQQPRNLGNVG
jgi:hypothetical protein